MALKSKKYWKPTAKGHLNAARSLSKNAPSLKKSGLAIKRKLASFRAAAKLAKIPDLEPVKMPPHLQPPSSLPPPMTKLDVSQPPKLPTTPGGD
jgi:hypothetical protein